MDKQMPIATVGQLCLGRLVKEFIEIRRIHLTSVSNRKRAEETDKWIPRDGVEQCGAVGGPSHDRPLGMVKGQPTRC
jgi:hypothetical protein